jgi:hypothetical protein
MTSSVQANKIKVDVRVRNLMNSEFSTLKKLGPGPMPAAVPRRPGVGESGVEEFGAGEFSVEELSADAFGVDVLMAQLPPA